MVNMNEDFGAYKDSIWKGLTARELGVMAVSAVSCGIIIILLYFILGCVHFLYRINSSFEKNPILFHPFQVYKKVGIFPDHYFSFFK